MLMKTLLSLFPCLIAVLLTGWIPPVSAQSAEMSWNLGQIVRSDDDPVMLRDSKGRLVRRLDASIPRYLYVVSRDIMAAAETQAEFFITTGSSPNAAAGVMNGRPTVLVNLAMIDMIGNDMNEWAGLIGHEVAHLTLDHQGQQADQTMKNTALQVITYGLIGGSGFDPLVDMAFQAYDTKFSRDAERESDYLGLIWSVETGYDPHGAAELHKKLRERSNGHPVPFLSTHPSSTERVRTLNDLANRLSSE